MQSPDDLATALGRSVDKRLATQLLEEAVALEEAFLLRKWKYSELDGGRFTEVAARILYSIDSGNIALHKSVDDCLRYIDNDAIPHAWPERQGAIHLAKVIRAVYKLRSQRGAIHVSATYTANEIDSRLILESVRWVLADLLRLFVTSDREAVAAAIRNLCQFPQPLIRMYGELPLLQSTSFTIEEEILAHLLYAENGLTIGELIAAIPRDQSGVRRGVKRLASPQLRQVILTMARWRITDLGAARIEAKIAQEGVPLR
jgi:hypothetical protein